MFSQPVFGEEILYPIPVKQRKIYKYETSNRFRGLVTKRPCKLSTEEKEKIEETITEFESVWASMWACESSLVLIDGRPLWERRHGE